jgi:transposase
MFTGCYPTPKLAEEVEMSESKRFELMRPYTAGIDVGSRRHFVAPPGEAEGAAVRSFECFTKDLLEMGAWLASLGTMHVAMESTGVYWISVYEALSSMGFNVSLIDGRAAKALPGRKTDVQDCQWIRDLHAYGLVRPCMVPDGQVLALRSYWRQRHRLVAQRAEQVQLMQKALEQMNVQLHKVLSDLTTVSGQTIIAAILAGERDPAVLAKLVHKNVKASQETIRKSLVGTWAEHHLFALSQAVGTYTFFGNAIVECDGKIDAAMAALSASEPAGSNGKHAHRNKLSFDASEGLIAALGCDPTVIDGIDYNTAITLLSELGPDLGGAFPTDKHFTSYIRLAPTNHITGGRRKRKGKTPIGATKVSTALKLAAQGLYNSDCALGACLRRLKARLGPSKATTAVARKIAVAYYNLVVHGVQYQDPGAEAYENRFQQQRTRYLAKQAAKFGMQLVPLGTPQGVVEPGLT